MGGVWLRRSKKDDGFVIEPSCIIINGYSPTRPHIKKFFQKTKNELWYVNPKDIVTYYSFHNCKR